MTVFERIERAEGLAWLVSHLAGEEFGGTPACGPESGLDPELFHPISEEHTHQIARAKQCAARARCRAPACSRP